MRLLALVAAFVLVHGEPTAFRVEVSGQGPAMIRIPGLSSSGDTWKTTVDHDKNRYTCHVVTLTKDQVVQTFDEQFAGLRRLHFVLSETSRHFVMFDEPDWMFARMDAFFGDPAGATGDRGFAR